MSPEARVGLFTVVAVVVAFVFAYLLPGVGLRRPQGYTIVIAVNDASGIARGSAVRMSGVTVGQVTSIALSEDTNQALITLTIRPAFTVREGSRFQIATTGLVGDRYVAISPGPGPRRIAPGKPVPAEEAFSLERTAARLEQAADQVSRLVENANRLIADPQMQTDLRETLRAAREATTAARDVMIQAGRVASSIERTASTIEDVAGSVRRVVDTDVVAVAQDLRTMSQSLVESSERVQAFVESTAGDGTLSRDIRDTAASLRETGQRIRQMAEDLQGVINPEHVTKARAVVDDFHVGVKEARAVVQQAGSIVQRIDGLLPRSLRIPDRRGLVMLTYDVSYDGRRGAHGMDVTLLPSGDRFYRFGVHDIGATSGLVLQAGSRLNSTLWWRGGIYESQLGLGLDYRPGGPLTVALDVYNLNTVTVDARLRYQLNRQWGLILGGTNLLRAPGFVFGLGSTF